MAGEQAAYRGMWWTVYVRKRKSETNGGGRRTYISPKGCPTHQVKHGAKKHNGHSEMTETQTKTQKGNGNAAK